MIFLLKADALLLHSQLIEQFGGSHGLRDEGALESALTAAENRAYYENADLIQCAAAYAFHLSQAHAFIDGNKRVAAAAMEAFLDRNGVRLKATNRQLIRFFLDIAANRLSRDEVEQQLKEWAVPGSTNGTA